jgi:hypothetical protein
LATGCFPNEVNISTRAACARLSHQDKLRGLGIRVVAHCFRNGCQASGSLNQRLLDRG